MNKNCHIQTSQTSSETCLSTSKSTSAEEKSSSSNTTPLTGSAQSSTSVQTSTNTNPSNPNTTGPMSSTQSSQQPSAALTTHGTQTQSLLAVKALKRIASKIHDGQISHTVSLGSSTVMDARGESRHSLPLGEIMSIMGYLQLAVT